MSKPTKIALMEDRADQILESYKDNNRGGFQVDLVVAESGKGVYHEQASVAEKWAIDRYMRDYVSREVSRARVTVNGRSVRLWQVVQNSGVVLRHDIYVSFRSLYENALEHLDRVGDGIERAKDNLEVSLAYATAKKEQGSK